MSFIGKQPSNAPRVIGDAVVIGPGINLAHRVVRHGAWHLEWDIAPDALAAIMGTAYGKNLAFDDWRIMRVKAGIEAMTVSAHSAACLLAEMPEPVEHGLEKLQEAVSLLRSGLAPEHLSSALRKACRDLPAAPMETMRLMLCERGVMLGKTVVVALQDLSGDRVGLDLQGRDEPILALLSLAANSLRHPRLLDLLEGVSQSLQRGATAQAAIKLAHLGQPPLDHSGSVRALEIADQELRQGLRPFDLLKGMALLPWDARLSDWRKWWRKDWDETEHPRDDVGRFVSTGGTDVRSEAYFGEAMPPHVDVEDLPSPIPSPPHVDIEELPPPASVTTRSSSSVSDQEMRSAEEIDFGQQGVDFLIAREGGKFLAYPDKAGIPTIGYGHKIKPGEDFSNGIDEPTARQLLRQDIAEAEEAVTEAVAVALTQAQYDALVSFSYNVGANAFKRSTLVRLLNNADYTGAADQILRWNHATINGRKIVVFGLTNRREFERSLFLNGKYK